MPGKHTCKSSCSAKITSKLSKAVYGLLAFWILLPVSWVQAQQTREYIYLDGKLASVETGNPVAPVISGIFSSGITTTGATINWTTNEASDSQVDYGTTTSYGSSTALNGTMLTSHSQALSGLSPSTLYHYRVKSRNAGGALAVSQDYAFTTPDVIPPVISSVTSSSITGTGATINWTTNEASDSQVDYGTTTSYGSSTALNGSMVTSHSQGISGLSSNTLYHYRVKSRNAAGGLAISSDYTFTTLDTIPPIISGVTSSGMTGTGATINWTTNEASDSQVEYGTTVGYGSSTTLNSSMVTSHSQAITGLSANTLYHYRVKSRDAAGNLATSADYTFTTLSCSYSISPQFIYIGTSGGSGFTVAVTASSGCAWTAVSNNSWIIITSGSSGSGNGTVVYRVVGSKYTRTGTMTIAGKTFTVYQNGGD